MHTKMEMRSYEWGFGDLGIWGSPILQWVAKTQFCGYQ